uniref:Embigin n=1 Tax=Myripristis murdjan TaxID=586833 RepID=A0A667Y9H6_9TELE
MECTWTGNQNKLPNITGYWKKDGNEIDSRLTVPLENEQYNLKGVFDIVGEESLGNYSCVFGSEAKIEFVLAAPQMGEVRDKPIVSYAGDSVVIACKMEEPKPKPSTWHWYKANGTDKALIDAAAEPHRYQIHSEGGKSTLTVRNLTQADAGFYYCGAVYLISTSLGRLEVRVITFLEPLKPFIAIVVEVLVLVAVILLYERKSKKKSITGSQKTKKEKRENSGGEESSSVRQRKV